MNTYYLISGIILGLGFFISLFFILWGKRKQTKGIDSYKRIRDKLTVREPEPEKESYSGGGLSIGSLVGGFIVLFIVLLVGASLLPAISEQVGIAQTESNITGAGETMIGLVTLFFALAVACAAIGLAVSGLRGSGLI